MSTINGIRTVAVSVADQDEALTFYRDVLGFEVRFDGMAGAARWLEVAPAGAGVTLALTSDDGVHVALETGIRFTVPDAAAEHAELSREGVQVGELLLWPGVPPMFDFADPDGNRFVIVEVPSGSSR